MAESTRPAKLLCLFFVIHLSVLGGRVRCSVDERRVGEHLSLSLQCPAAPLHSRASCQLLSNAQGPWQQMQQSPPPDAPFN